MEKIEIPLSPFGTHSSKFTFRIDHVEFLTMEAILDGKNVQLETPDAVPYGVGYIYLRDKIADNYSGHSIPISYDGETVYIRNGTRAEILGIEYKLTEETQCELFEIDLEDHELALINECFTRFMNDGYMHTPIIAEIRAGRKIQAIKAYRIAHGVGLRESKAAVDLIWDRVRKNEPK